MQIDKKSLSALAELDDRALKEMIHDAIIRAGGNENQATAAMAAAPIIRMKLKNASDKDIGQLLSFLGQKNAQDILNSYGK